MQSLNRFRSRASSDGTLCGGLIPRRLESFLLFKKSKSGKDGAKGNQNNERPEDSLLQWGVPM